VGQAVYEATSKVKLAIAPPRIMGVIKECGGKMWMSERQWARISNQSQEDC
jgi:COP9 signalosome complex subunit 2